MSRVSLSTASTTSLAAAGFVGGLGLLGACAPHGVEGPELSLPPAGRITSLAAAADAPARDELACTPTPPLPLAPSLGACPDPMPEREAVVATGLGFEAAGFVVSPVDPQRRAAWDDADLYVSEDGGESWEQHLQTPPRDCAYDTANDFILDAGYDCHGRLFVLRGDGRLGLRELDGRETWGQLEWPALRQAFYGDARLWFWGEDATVLFGADDGEHPTVSWVRPLAGQWRRETLVELESDSWDGIELSKLEALGPSRLRAWLRPYDDGECGDEAFHRVDLNLAEPRVLRVETREADRELPEDWPFE